MPQVGFEPIISAGERPQTYALDRAAIGTGLIIYTIKSHENCFKDLLTAFNRIREDGWQVETRHSV